MRKSLLKIPIILMSIGVLSGCGAEEVESGQYVQAEGIDRAYEISFIEVESEQEADEPVREPVRSEATGLEQEKSRVVLENADIYNQPSKDAVKIGSIREGERISLIGMSEDGAWCKINYNGRVAYIMADAVGEEETGNVPKEEEETEEETPEKQNPAVGGIDGNTNQPAGTQGNEGGEAQNQEESTDQGDESDKNGHTVSENLGGDIFGTGTQ